MSRTPVAAGLPDFPWDSLADVTAKAHSHPDGIVNLSVGTPVDPVDPVIQEALASVAEVPGYPTTHGTLALRQAVAESLDRRYNIPDVDPAAVLPAIGTKEMIAWLPKLLGLGADDLVVIPELAYPTYEVAAKLAGARVLRADGLNKLGPESAAMIFVNSPSNPTGKVLGLEHLQKVVAWAREARRDRRLRRVLPRIDVGSGCTLHSRSRVNDGDLTGLLAVHSLSKTSNLASYRAGFVTGDPALVSELLEVRKHAGMILPLPIQAAMTAALGDDQHENIQRASGTASVVVC